jgi:2-phospho-L-lactate/phosphoenolpyruvate guanylyltransferase
MSTAMANGFNSLRSDLWALVPIKAFDDAKTRLAEALSARQRHDFARAMAEKVIRELLRQQNLAGVAIVTGDRDVAAFSRLLGAQVIRENNSSTLTQAVAGGVSQLFGEVATAVLVVPADIPLIRADDISALVAGRIQADVTIVPSRDGGTNALLLNADCPPLFAFGPDSAARHRGRAEAVGLSVQMRDFPLLAFDIGTIEDLRELATCDIEASIRAAITDPVAAKKRAPSAG